MGRVLSSGISNYFLAITTFFNNSRYLLTDTKQYFNVIQHKNNLKFIKINMILAIVIAFFLSYY